MQRLYDKMGINFKYDELFLRLKNKKILIITLVIGVALMLLGNSDGNEKQNITEKEHSRAYLDEKKLEKILESIEGAGKVKVFVTYEGNGENIPAYDYKRETTKDSDRVEIDIKSENGSPYIVKELNPVIKGILVTATGADTYDLKMKLLKSVKAATGIPSNRIYIEKGE